MVAVATGKSARQVLRVGVCQLFRPGAWWAEDRGGQRDRVGVGRWLGRVRGPGARCRRSAGCGWAAAARSSQAAARAANQDGRQAVMAPGGRWLAAAVRDR